MVESHITLKASRWHPLIYSLGSNQFKHRFIDTLNTLLTVDHCALLHRHSSGALRYITSISAEGVTIPELTKKRYLDQYYHLDPDQKLVNGSLKENELIIRHLAASDIKQNDYRYYCYERANIIDRLSVLCCADDGIYCCNLYRIAQSGLFSQHDITALTDVAALLMALVVKHGRVAGDLLPLLSREMRINELIRRLQQVNQLLTQRELQVCSRILLGMRTEGIALDLSVKISTIQTYRKRAYQKLQISSQNELFALSLNTPDN